MWFWSYNSRKPRRRDDAVNVFVGVIYYSISQLIRVSNKVADLSHYIISSSAEKLQRDKRDPSTENTGPEIRANLSLWE